MSGIEIFLSLKDARYEAQPWDGHEISNASAELSVPGMFHITIHGSAPDWHRLALWAEECATARKKTGE